MPKSSKATAKPKLIKASDVKLWERRIIPEEDRIKTSGSSYMDCVRAAIKVNRERCPSIVTLFKVGDFYEAFDEDALTLAKLFSFTVTTRRDGDDKIDMTGLPYHRLENYLQRLLQAGHKVAICEQVKP